jgi:hypothetical protein
MTTDLDRKREYLTSLYPGYSWHNKVATMSPERVIAVYLRFQRDGPPKLEPKLNPKPKLPDDSKPDVDDDQLPLF